MFVHQMIISFIVFAGLFGVMSVDGKKKDVPRVPNQYRAMYPYRQPQNLPPQKVVSNGNYRSFDQLQQDEAQMEYYHHLRTMMNNNRCYRPTVPTPQPKVVYIPVTVKSQTQFDSPLGPKVGRGDKQSVKMAFWILLLGLSYFWWSWK